MTQKIEAKKLVATAVLLERFVRGIYPSKHSSTIQPLQWSILRYLARMPADRCEVRWIAQFLGLTRAPVTRAVATLETRKLITQRPSDEDARTKTIVLTELGEASLKKDPILAAAERMRCLSDAEQAHFITAVRTLALHAEESHDEYD